MQEIELKCCKCKNNVEIVINVKCNNKIMYKCENLNCNFEICEEFYEQEKAPEPDESRHPSIGPQR